MNNSHVQNKTVLITGASRGVGFAAAKLFSQNGATVFICSRNENEIDNAAEQIMAETGKKVFSVAADVSKSRDVNRLFEFISQQGATLDICINNAGFLKVKSFIELTESDWQQTLSANLDSVFLCSQAAFKMMSQTSTKNFIVNVGSLSGIQTVEKFPGMSAYVAAKSAVSGLTEALAVEGKSCNIHVNAIAPGAIATQMFDQNFGDMRIEAGAQPQQIAEMILNLCNPNGLGLSSGTLIPIYCNA